MAGTASAQVVFTEIHYHPVEEEAFNADGTPVLDLAEHIHEFVEIQNTGASNLDLGGWALTGAIDFTFPAGTTIAAGGYAVFYESQFNAGANAFSLNSTGDEAVLSAVDGGGALTGCRAQVSFGAAADNVSFGRVSTASGAEFWPQISTTLGSANGPPKTTPVIFNEVMYHPVDDAGGADNSQNEFIELHNPAAGAVDVGGWRMKGDSDFTFAAGASVPANGYVLLVTFDPANAATLAAFRAKYGLSAATPIAGPYAPMLSNATQNLELAFPAVFAGATHFVLVDKVEYRDIAPWPTGADGTGNSLQRLNRTIIGNDAANWSAAAPTPGAVNAGVVTELTISTDSPLPGAVQSIAYSASLAASGGTAPYSWNVSAGALPDGLTLSAAGVIGGAPTASGGFTFAAQVTNGVNATKTKVFTLTVAASALTITTVSPLPDGIYAAAYSQTLSATGGTAPVHVDGQRRSRAGRFVAQHRGRAQRHRDRAGRVQFCRARRRQRRTDRDASIRNHGSRAAAHHHEHFAAAIRRALTVAYSQALIAVGGVGSYAWSISVGALPAGLSLSGAEDLSGTPAASGTFNFTLRATDGAGTQAVKAFTLIVTPAPLVISSGATLADGTVGSVYSQTLAATGGVLPYAWSVGGGTLPGGLTKLNVEPPQAPRASRHALCKSPPLRGAELSTFNFQSLAAAPACTTF